MLIKTYGLYWKRDDVFWGRQKNAGRLVGRKLVSRRAALVDFRDQVGFYALYDEQFQLVYFGQAGRGQTQTLYGRLKQHLSDHLAERWTRFSWFGAKYVKTDGTLSAKVANVQGRQEVFLDQVEAVMIAVSEPPNNLQGGRFGRADQYAQHRDVDKLGPSHEEMLRIVFERLE